jgi:hypothetical protein
VPLSIILHGLSLRKLRRANKDLAAFASFDPDQSETRRLVVCQAAYICAALRPSITRFHPDYL